MHNAIMETTPKRITPIYNKHNIKRKFRIK